MSWKRWSYKNLSNCERWYNHKIVGLPGTNEFKWCSISLWLSAWGIYPCQKIFCSSRDLGKSPLVLWVHLFHHGFHWQRAYWCAQEIWFMRLLPLSRELLSLWIRCTDLDLVCLIFLFWSGVFLVLGSLHVRIFFIFDSVFHYCICCGGKSIIVFDTEVKKV